MVRESHGGRHSRETNDDEVAMFWSQHEGMTGEQKMLQRDVVGNWDSA